MHRHRDPQAPPERDHQCASRYRPPWNDREQHPDRALARTRADRLRHYRRRTGDRADRRRRPHLRQARSFGPIFRLRHRPGGNVNRPLLDLRLWRRPGHNRHLHHNQANSVNRLPLSLHRCHQPDRRRHPAGGKSLLLLNLRLYRRRLDHRPHRPAASVNRPHSGRRRCRREARHLRLRADNANPQQ